MSHRSPSSNAVLNHCLRVLLAVSALMPLWSDAQEPNQANRGVRRYPDPGYRLMGVYAGGPDAYFDYSLAKMSLGDTFPNKGQWWAVLKKNGLAHKHISTPSTLGSVKERTLKRVDGASTPGSSPKLTRQPIRNCSRQSAWKRRTAAVARRCSTDWRDTFAKTMVSLSSNGTPTRWGRTRH